MSSRQFRVMALAQLSLSSILVFPSSCTGKRGEHDNDNDNSPTTQKTEFLCSAPRATSLCCRRPAQRHACCGWPTAFCTGNDFFEIHGARPLHMHLCPHPPLNGARMRHTEERARRDPTADGDRDAVRTYDHVTASRVTRDAQPTNRETCAT